MRKKAVILEEFELPDVFTKTYLEKWEWRKAPVDGFEACELGLIRRPLDYCVKGIRAGMLHTSRVTKLTPGHFSLTPRNRHSSGCVRYTPQELMVLVFGRCRNTGLLDMLYCHRLCILSKLYNSKNRITITEYKESIRSTAIDTGMTPLRKCHDCGRPTRNYRCEACWALVQQGISGCEDPAEEYGVAR